MKADATPVPPRAFISHASEDKSDFAEPLARELAELGIAPWLDKWEIRPGDSLVQKLFDEGLSTVDAVIVIVSATSVGKPWVREELDAAMVSRITRSTRLIPIRLDGADVPAPLRHLVWISSGRSREKIHEAASQITDTLYKVDTRPAVASAPRYITREGIPGLTAADTTLLVAIAEYALEIDSLVGLTWPRVVERAETKDLRGAVLDESLAALRQRGFVKIQYAGNVPYLVEFTRTGFSRAVDIVVPAAEEKRQKIILKLVNDPPATQSAVDELATECGGSRLFVLEFLKKLESQGHLKLLLTSGNGSRVFAIEPTLRRLVS
jgi:TIR domain